MDNSPPESDRSPQELSPADSRPPESRSARRRLVQSTLFPQKPQPKDGEENGDGKDDRDRGEGDNGGGEDEDSSQSKRKRKAKGKTTPSKRSSEKAKGKRSVSTTPKKNLVNILNEEAPIVVPNLRLEAKLTAEENSRLYAGRQIHPFFSSCKAGKKNQEVIDLEGKQVAVSRANKVINCGPIHVFEKTEDNDEPLDWRTWTFREGIFVKKSFVRESTCSSIVEGSVECLSFDKFSVISQLKNTSISGDEVPSNQCRIQGECTYELVPTASNIANDEKVVSYQPFKDAVDNKVNKVDSFTWHTSGVWKPDIGQESRFLDERMKSYYFGCDSQPGDGLWTDKYQPKKAMEVCGNDESVKFLAEWLQKWRERKFQINKDIDCDTGDMQDNDYICSESDSAAENEHEETGLKNVLLVTGPVGSGKSAAIYACAQEQGFEVLEVNTSECRNGALVKQRFGEALESRQLKRSLANPACSPNKQTVKPFSDMVNGISTQKSDDGLVDLIALSDEDCLPEIEGSGFSNYKGAGSCSNQVEVKPLILFEDVDITFLEDRGFIAAVQQISETAKGPIILTSNSHNPLLPDNLNRLQICFEPVPTKDLLCHVYMICVAEKANMHPYLLERLIACCEGDIRKAITHLQFWCQGKSSRKARKIQRTHGSVLFDLEAGHQILPKLIPWNLPSQLSELVEKEITESLSREEDSSFMDVIEEEALDQSETHYPFMHTNGKDTIEAKKAVMLSRNCNDNGYDEFRAQIDPVHEFSDNSDTPFSCFRPNSRKQHDTVLSSDSEDELMDNGCNIRLDTDMNNEALLEGGLPFDELPCSAAADVDEKPNHYAESESFMPINYDDCKSLDVSHVPESSFVPETIISNDTEVNFRKPSSDCAEEVSVSNGLIVAPDDLDISLEIQNDSDTLLGSQSVISELCQQEEVEDSQNEHAGAVAIGYQLLDESSRMDYRRLVKYVEKPKPLAVTDLVQKSWDKLRSCRADLAQYVKSEGQHLQIAKLTYEMSNLISETDMLISNSQIIASDPLEQSMIQSEESDAYSLYDTALLASTTAEHGFCFYAKSIAAVGSTLGSESSVDLASEMLASTTGLMESDESVRQDIETRNNSYSRRSLESSMEEDDTSFKSGLFDILQSIVPPKSYTTLKGAAFYEYLSSLRCISSSETSRLSQTNERPRKRRRRADRHYLSNGTLMLTPEEILSLGQIKSFIANSSQRANSV